MSGGLYIGGDTSGSVLLYPTPVAGSTTITIAAQSGTLNVAGPTFSAYSGAGQNVSATSSATVQYNTEVWDTANCYDTSTYRFTPNVAGYYQVNAGVGWTSLPSGECNVAIMKNGSEYRRGFDSASGVTMPYGSTVHGIVYLNGTTDYIYIATYNGSGSTRQIGGGSSYAPVCFFDACFLRGA